MDVWVDIHSGTFGAGLDAIVYVEMSDEDVEVFESLADSERIAVAKAMDSNSDDPEFDFTSALAACGL